MNPELILYKRFNDAALAGDLTDALDDAAIAYTVEESTPAFDPAFRNDGLTKEYSIKISPDDFERVNKLLKERELANINNVDKEHYLFSFTNEELTDVLAKADEWSAFDYQLARKILTERGVTINDAMLNNFSNARLEELKKPEPPQNGWIIAGYIVAFAGGVFGIFIGWHLANYKKTLPDGEIVYGYSENDRQQGKWIMYLSIFIFAFAIFMRLLRIFTE